MTKTHLNPRPIPTIRAMVVPITVKKLFIPQAHGIKFDVFFIYANPEGNGIPSRKPSGKIESAAMINFANND